jgi:class 3 adenylate cyclase/tetratricopeptide (TPR) repeat protein
LLGERLDPEPLRYVMIRYQELARAAVERYGGSVEKFIGDAVMGVFGAPTLHEDDALRCVHAAVEIRAAVARLNAELRAALGIDLRVRIGINTGEVVAAGGRTDQMLVSGDAVNTAARFQQAAGPSEILIGWPTHALVRDTVDVEPAPPLELKGKSAPVPVWRLTGVRQGMRGVERRMDRPLFGRADELAHLLTALAVARRSGLCHLLTLLGEPGIGKSRLALEVRMAAERDGALVLTGACHPFQRGDTYEPLTQALGGLGAVPSLEATTEEVFWTVRKMLVSAAADCGVLLVLDDLQWASPGLLDLLDHLADAVRGVSLTLLCVARLDLLDRRPGWAGGKLSAGTIVLSALEQGPALELAHGLAEVTGHGDAAETVLRRVVATTGGNPLFIEQMIASLRDDTPTPGLPSTIQTLIAARLDRLDRDARTVLGHAAMVGDEFEPELLAELGKAEPVADLPTVLARLERRWLIEAVGPQAAGTFRFRNTQIREVAYAGLAKAYRAELHERIADRATGDDALAADEGAGRHFEIAARLYTELGRPDHAERMRAGARRILGRVGSRALARGDLSAARDLLRRALDGCSPDDAELPDLQVALGNALLASGRAEEASSVLRGLLDRSERTGDVRAKTHAVLGLARIGDGATPVEDLLDRAERAVVVFTEHHDHDGLARSLLLAGQARQAAGQYGSAVRALERSLESALRAGTALETAGALGGLAMSMWLGPMSADAAIARCEELLGSLPNGKGLVEVAITGPLAVLLAMRERFDEGAALLRRAEDVAEDIGHPYVTATLPLFTGRLLSLRGDAAAAERTLRGALAALTRIGDSSAAVGATADLARVLLTLGRAEEAAALLADSPVGGSPSQPAGWHGARACACARTGRTDVATTEIELALQAAGRTDSPDIQATALLDKARVLVATGGPAVEAAQAAQAAEQRYRDKGNAAGVAQAAKILRGDGGSAL